MSAAVGTAGERGRLAGRLVIATHNAGKLREFDELLRPFGLTLLGAAALGLEEPEETGSTFRDNAVLKARAAAQASGLPALSDDSGLCVEALEDAPASIRPDGLGRRKTLRRHGPGRARTQRAAAPPPWRAAFVSVLALAWPDGADEAFEGRVDGTLVFPPRGTAGFGYDPIFRPDGHNRTFGEMRAEESMAFPPTARSPCRIAPARSRSLRARGCDAEWPSKALRSGWTSARRDFRVHFERFQGLAAPFRVVPAPNPKSVGGAAFR